MSNSGQENTQQDLDIEDIENDSRLGWIVKYMQCTIRSCKVNELKQFIMEKKPTIDQFLNGDKGNCIRMLLFREYRNEKFGLHLCTTATIPAKFDLSSVGEQWYFVKLHKSKVSSCNFEHEVVVGNIADSSMDILTHLNLTMGKVFTPLVRNEHNKDKWPEMINNDVSSNMTSFMSTTQIMAGQSKGETWLPLPANMKDPDSSEMESDPSVTSTSFPTAGKDRVHLLEGCLITWTKQIKAVLRQDPETVFNENCDHPGPLAEIEFWEKKAQNLNSIFEQLQGESIRKVLYYLDQSKSTYNLPFAKLCKEVFRARDEANNNTTYLKPLLPIILRFEENDSDCYMQLELMFHPIMRCLLRIWKQSKYYNSIGRLVVFMRMLCNSTIRKSYQFFSGKQVFDCIDNNDTKKSAAMMQLIIKSCATLKNVFLEHKAVTLVECPDNAWNCPNSALFMRLDGFLERCHDILEFSQTFCQFNKLQKIEIGGTKGKTLTNSAQQVHFDFLDAVAMVRGVNYDIMNLDARAFDDDFYEFRTKIKELERRIASVLTQAFDDCSGIQGKLSLLDSFDDILARSIIKNELDKKSSALISAFNDDLHIVQSIFLELRDNPPISHNLPPFAGALSWARGLLDRISCPLERLQNLNSAVAERTDSAQAIRTYTTLAATLAEYEREMKDTWAGSIESATKAKLKLPLMRRDTENNLLIVNFDPVLVGLLREVKYFLKLGAKSIPESALAIYRKAEVFRRQTGNLELIVNMYNGIQTKLLHVERPLIKGHLDRIDDTLSRGLRTINWKSHGIDIFLKETMTDVNDANLLLESMKKNYSRIESIIKSWSDRPLFERKSKPLSILEFEQSQSSLRQSAYVAIEADGQEIHDLLRESLRRLKISQGSPDWRTYIDFVSTNVVSGLADAIASSLKTLLEQLNPESAESTELTPLVEIELDLYGREVIFAPEVGYVKSNAEVAGVPIESFEESDTASSYQLRSNWNTPISAGSGLGDIILHWVEIIFGISTLFQRLDTNDGTYLKEMRSYPIIKELLVQINASIIANEKVSNELKLNYRKYEYLWTSDLLEMFTSFLAESTKQSSVKLSARKDMNLEPLDLTRKGNTLTLADFDAKIKHYLTLQTETSELKHVMDVRFVRINSQPIKQALSTWVTKWVYMFTQYLQDTVLLTLNSANAFLQRIECGLSIEARTTSKNELLECMGHIRDSRIRMDQIQQSISPLREIVSLLIRFGINFDAMFVGNGEIREKVIPFLEQVPTRWEHAVNLTFKKKEVIQPFRVQTMEIIRSDGQEFESKVMNFYNEFLNTAPFSATYVEAMDKNNRRLSISPLNHAQAALMYQKLDDYYARLIVLKAEESTLHDLQDLFEMSRASYPKLDEVKDMLLSLKYVWDLLSLAHHTFDCWRSISWSGFNTEACMDATFQFRNQISMLAFPAPTWDIIKGLNESVSTMELMLPLAHAMRGTAIRERHWKLLVQVSGSPLDMDVDLSFEDIMQLELHLLADEVNDIVNSAVRENKIDSQVSDIEAHWSREVLNFEPTDDPEMFLLAPPEVVMETLEEHQMMLQAMLASGKYVDFVREKVSDWQFCLGMVDTTLKLLFSVQSQWRSLESIFLTSQDIRAQLPVETKRFESVNIEVKEVLLTLVKIKNVIPACRQEGQEEALSGIQQSLEFCQKALNSYLKGKKDLFPRFYFVSSKVLLDILSNGNNPPKIIPFLGDCFDAIASAVFKIDPQGDQSIAAVACSITSKDGEVVTLKQPTLMTGAVELWLQDFADTIEQTLKATLILALEAVVSWEVDLPRDNWMFKYPAQISLLASQITWTEEVENAIEGIENGQDDALRLYFDTCVDRLRTIVKLAVNDMSSGDRVKLVSLITLDVHARDIVQTLSNESVASVSHFQWRSKLRSYFRMNSQEHESERKELSSQKLPEDECPPTTIHLSEFATTYSYEYIGNCGRLVITPLTDRCYVTLTTALHLRLGGAPSGPAGTGKTETTKDLARSLGLHCYVFNCSDQINCDAMSTIFKGLAQTGSWGCFDEFNRIPIEVLSVVATQLRTVLDAIGLFAEPSSREPRYQHAPTGSPPCRVGEFSFDGDEVFLVPTCGFFITMNPGYAGRTELPENLKSLFRSCAMICPDLQPICENMLMAAGYQTSRSLSKKIVSLYALCEQLLTLQPHYDWGLRAIKSVLQVAGELKRKHAKLGEDTILRQALAVSNISKLPSFDVPVFIGLLSDFFPAAKEFTNTTKPFRELCIATCKKAGLQADKVFVTKIVELQQAVSTRHSVMILGHAGCGKSTLWRTLTMCQNASSEKQNTVFATLNPKTLSSNELYGYVTESQDWKDGVLSNLMRNMAKENPPFTNSQSSKWVVLDGDIDALWIESMNTVMDDNKVLTLVSNERISLTDSMRLIFEIYSLENASPATVSRAGVVHMNENDVNWQMILDSWLHKRQSIKELENLPKLLEKYVEAAYEILRGKGLSPIVRMPKISYLTSFLKILDSELVKLDEAKKSYDICETLVSFSIIWSFGAALSAESGLNAKTIFSQHFQKELLTGKSDLTDSDDKKFPSVGNVFDYFFDVHDLTVRKWADIVPNFSGLNENSWSSLIVPTSDSVKLSYLMRSIFNNVKSPILLVGSAGTGKTVIIKDYMKNVDEDKTSCSINLNYYTSAAILQHQIESYLEKRTGKIYGPIGNKELICYIDDLNMPMTETFGTQAPLALLRQFLDEAAWYDRNDLSIKKIIRDTQLVSSMNHTAGSFSINPRLQRYFTTFSCTSPSMTNLSLIFMSLLDGHLSMFADSIRSLQSTIVRATLELHHEVLENFLPTALKPHYQFNMRELARVFQGFLTVQSSLCDSPQKFARLWLHECSRVYSDRLVSQIELGRFNEILVEQSKKHFEEDQELLHVKPLIFVGFIEPKGAAKAAYDEIKGMNELKLSLQNCLLRYNECNPIMQLVMFDQAVEHVSRVIRIIMNPRGNALLVGVGGSGKQSLTKLAAFICGYKVEQLIPSPSYGNAEFVECLKDLYRYAGAKPGLPVVFLMSESSIPEECFLIHLNDILTNGNLGDVFSDDEYEMILNTLRVEAKQFGIPDSKSALMEFFIERIRANLRIVLAFSPVGDLLRTRTRRFPSIASCTTIDWFHPWPKEALVSVAQTFLEEVQFETPAIRENVAHHVAEVHLSVIETSSNFLKKTLRHNYVTPVSFLELIKYYKNLLIEKQALQHNQIERLGAGLTTLENTANNVECLQVDLKQTLGRVEEKKKATDELLEKMGEQKSEAELKQAKADIERAKANAAASKADKIEREASKELQSAKPVLEAAKEAINCLSKASLTELKSLSKPPSGVEKVTMAVLMLVKGETKNFSWENAKKMMAKIDAFKSTLETFKGETIPSDIVLKVEPILMDPNFSYDKMKAKSLAAANLCVWVINIVSYNKVYRKVKPLMDALDEAKSFRAAADKELGSIEGIVRELEDQLVKLQESFRLATNEKALVEAEALSCQERLSLAERLVHGLASENDRWGREIDILRQKTKCLVGDVLLSSAFVSYIGAFDSSFRKVLWKDTWLADLCSREIPTTEEADPLDILSDDAEICVWLHDGLQSDRMSIENGCIATSVHRWPLMVDPQLQGLDWIQHHAANARGTSNVVNISAGQGDWVKKLAHATSNGFAVIITGISETLDSQLTPLLSRAVYKKGKQLLVQLQDNEIIFDPNFRLFLHTELPNPHYAPEVSSQCTIINFAVTSQGLEDQLLAKVVSREKPALERERKELQQAFNRYKVELVDLENQLLERLAKAPKDILSDVALIEGLEATKKTANEVNIAVAKGQEAEKTINDAREVYRRVAVEGSMLYFMITGLHSMNYVYQYSLDYFTYYFFKAMDETGNVEDDLDFHVETLRENLRKIIYTAVRRGLEEKHHLPFLTLLCFTLLGRGIIGHHTGYTREALKILVAGQKVVTDDENPLDWLTDSQWQSLQGLGVIHEFERFTADLEESEARFKVWHSSSVPESEKLPLEWRELDKTPFLKLLVVRCMRPDRLITGISNFIQNTLPNGLDYLNCDSESSSSQILEQSYADSAPQKPIYFLLSPGIDIMEDIKKLAITHAMDQGQNFFTVSLGQGQDLVAADLLNRASKEGHWVVLQNIHLMPSWLPTLVQILNKFNQGSVHKSFRVFLSSAASSTIPMPLLDRAIKICNEIPSGVRSNLKRALKSIGTEEFNSLESKTRTIIFATCYFHSIMVERRCFGSSGFNSNYPFSIGDLRSSISILLNVLEVGTGNVPWANLQYLVGDIIYGGHIINEIDRLVCTTYLQYFYCEKLLEELEMFPYVAHDPEMKKTKNNSFLCPKLHCSFEEVIDSIDGNLTSESTILFGMHPNTGISARIEQGSQLCKTILNLQFGSDGVENSSDSLQGNVECILQDVAETYRDTRFDVNIDVSDDSTPFFKVWQQECSRMNNLLQLITSSLAALESGLRGHLAITEEMDSLMHALYYEQVPDIWAKAAFPSTRALSPWMENLNARIEQLQEWRSSPNDAPIVTWISGLFNPESFLTAILQTTSRKSNLELEKLIVTSEVLKKPKESFDAAARDGNYICGLHLQGARWNTHSGLMESSSPKELNFPMPVINCRSTLHDRCEQVDMYNCPVYKTELRNDTFVFSIQLRTKEKAAKWILAGAALIMDVQ